MAQGRTPGQEISWEVRIIRNQNKILSSWNLFKMALLLKSLTCFWSISFREKLEYLIWSYSDIWKQIYCCFLCNSWLQEEPRPGRVLGQYGLSEIRKTCCLVETWKVYPASDIFLSGRNFNLSSVRILRSGDKSNAVFYVRKVIC